MYRVNGADPHNYDMVLDSESLGLEIVAEVLIRAIEAGRPGAATNPATTSAKPWTVPPPSPEAAGPTSPPAADAVDRPA